MRVKPFVQRRRMIMKRRSVLQFNAIFLVLLSGAIAVLPAARADESKDVPLVARSSEQLTLMALGKACLTNIIARVEKTQSGTVFSVTPVIRNHKAVAEVLVADDGKVKKVFQPL